MEFTLLWAALTGIALAWVGLRYLGPAQSGSLDHLIVAASAGLLAGRLGAMILQGTNPATHPGDIFVVRGGVNTAVASAAAGLVLLYRLRADKVALALLIPGAVLGLAGWQFGCIWRGACLGAASSLPWSWSAPGSTVTRHPVEIYTALGIVLTAFLVNRVPSTPAMRLGSELAGVSLSRLATEPFRLSVVGGSAGTYWVGVIVGLTILGTSVFVAKQGNSLKLEYTTRTRETHPGESEHLDPTSFP